MEFGGFKNAGHLRAAVLFRVSTKTGSVFYTRFRQREIFLCLSRVGKCKHFRGNRSARVCFTHDSDKGGISIFPNRVGQLKTFPRGNQAAGQTFSFESLKWGRFPRTIQTKGIFLCLSRVGKLEKFSRRNQHAGPPFSFDPVKWGSFFTRDSDKWGYSFV